MKKMKQQVALCGESAWEENTEWINTNVSPFVRPTNSSISRSVCGSFRFFIVPENFIYWKRRNSFSLVKTVCSCETWGCHSGTAVKLRCFDWRLATDRSKVLGHLDLPDEGTFTLPDVGHYLPVDWPNVLNCLNVQFQTVIFPGNTRQ